MGVERRRQQALASDESGVNLCNVGVELRRSAIEVVYTSNVAVVIVGRPAAGGKHVLAIFNRETLPRPLSLDTSHQDSRPC